MKKCGRSIVGNSGDVCTTVCGPDLGLIPTPTQLCYFLSNIAVGACG